MSTKTHVGQLVDFLAYIGDHLIVPNAYLDELRQLPDDEIDVLKAFTDV